MVTTMSGGKEVKTGTRISTTEGQASLGRLRPIEPVRIVLKEDLTDEALEGTIAWVEEYGYKVVSRQISSRLAPFNAVIRVRQPDAKGEYRYYLAELDS